MGAPDFGAPGFLPALKELSSSVKSLLDIKWLNASLCGGIKEKIPAHSQCGRAEWRAVAFVYIDQLAGLSPLKRRLVPALTGDAPCLIEARK